MGDSREKFSSRLGFIFATVGFAIGLGTFWRFPFLCGQYGGAAFLFLYLLAILFVALPLLTLELSIGAATQSGPVGAYKNLAGSKSCWKWIGWMNVLAMFLLVGYTIPIGGWILGYIPRAAMSVFSNLQPAEVEAYFGAFLGRQPEIIAWTAFLLLLIALIIRKDLNTGLEKANRLCMQLLLGILLLLCARSLTLPGASAGIEFFLKPDWSKVTRDAALTAVGQAFYAIGVAMSVGIVFGSYMKDEDKKIISSALTVGGSIIAVGFLAGLMIFPAVFAFGLQATAGPSLVFITMPNVFNQMPAGAFFATLFYVLFFLAALSSWLGGCEALISTMKEEWGISRDRGTLLLVTTLFVIAIASSLSGSIFEKLDFLVTNILLISGAFGGALYGGWVWKLKGYSDQCRLKKGSFSLKALSFLIQIVAPLVIIAIALSAFKII